MTTETTTYEITVEPTPESWTTTSIWENGKRVGEKPWLSRQAGYQAKIDGRAYQGLWSTDETKARKAAERAVARIEADDQVRPECQRVLATLTGDQADENFPLGQPLEAGDTVAIHGRGKIRVGIATKVGPKNVEVAFVTPASPDRVTRKTVRKDLVGRAR